MSVDAAADLWLCVEAGPLVEPGTWTRLLREDSTSGRVVPITPVRVLDTRSAGGRSAGSPVVPAPSSLRYHLVLDIVAYLT